MLPTGADIADFKSEVFGDLGLKIQTVSLKDRRLNVLRQREHALQPGEGRIGEREIWNELWERPRISEERVRQAAGYVGDRKSTRLNSSHIPLSRMPSS